jgi:hypothetical protein
VEPLGAREVGPLVELGQVRAGERHHQHAASFRGRPAEEGGPGRDDPRAQAPAPPFGRIASDRQDSSSGVLPENVTLVSATGCPSS